MEVTGAVGDIDGDGTMGIHPGKHGSHQIAAQQSDDEKCIVFRGEMYSTRPIQLIDVANMRDDLIKYVFNALKVRKKLKYICQV